MRPYDDLRGVMAELEVPHERVEGVDHVRVAKVPGRDAAAEHGAVVLLGVSDQAGVLFGGEELFDRSPPVAACIFGGTAAHVDELRDNLGFAGVAEAESGGIAVGLRVFAEVFEAGVAVAGARRSFRIHLVEIGEYRLHRSVHAVEIEAEEAGFGLPLGERVIVSAQPADEVEDVGVAPHPCRKALKSIQGLGGIDVLAEALHVAVDAVGVGPVRFDGDGAEAFLANETLSDQCAVAVELMGSVGGFSDEYEASISDEVEQAVVVCRRAGQGMSSIPHQVDRYGKSRVLHTPIHLARLRYGQPRQFVALIIRALPPCWPRSRQRSRQHSFRCSLPARDSARTTRLPSARLPRGFPAPRRGVWHWARWPSS